MDGAQQQQADNDSRPWKQAIERWRSGVELEFVSALIGFEAEQKAPYIPRSEPIDWPP